MVLNECVHDVGRLLHTNHWEHRMLQWRSDRPLSGPQTEATLGVRQVLAGPDGYAQRETGVVQEEGRVG